MWVTPPRRERTSQVHESRGTERRRESVDHGQGIERGESRGGYWEGETSESMNPRDGIGMKQGRRDEGGGKRQEVEKTWRRTVAGRGKLGASGCARSTNVIGEETPGRAVRIVPSRSRTRLVGSRGVAPFGVRRCS
jgi:hypothetical protein